MEEKKRNRDMERNERDIVRTQAVKAGKRKTVRLSLP